MIPRFQMAETPKSFVEEKLLSLHLNDRPKRSRYPDPVSTTSKFPSRPSLPLFPSKSVPGHTQGDPTDKTLLKMQAFGDSDFQEEGNETVRFAGDQFEDRIFPFGRRSPLQESYPLQENFQTILNRVSGLVGS